MVRVYYRDKNNSSLKKLFWSRGIRTFNNGNYVEPCIFLNKKIYKVFPYQENIIDKVFFDINSPLGVKPKDCPFANDQHAKDMLNKLSPIEDLSFNSQFQESRYEQIIDITSSDIPEFVFTDPIKLSMALTNDAKEVSIQPKINLHRFKFPQFVNEWFIERTKWYVYVLVNKDAELPEIFLLKFILGYAQALIHQNQTSARSDFSSRGWRELPLSNSCG